MRVFWWSDPMSQTRTLRTADMTEGQHARIDTMDAYDVGGVLAAFAENGHEISWQTAQLLGWPT